MTRRHFSPSIKGFAAAVIVSLAALTSAQAQTICGLSSTGGEPQTPQGATANGIFSMACGSSASATNDATAVGITASATSSTTGSSNFSASAFGSGSTANGDGSTAIGGAATANLYATAVGASAEAVGNSSIAISATSASTERATSFGTGAIAVGTNVLSGGNRFDNSFTNANTIAIGTQSQAGTAHGGADNAVAIGFRATANGASSFAGGDTAQATGIAATAIGYRAQATDQNSLALGTTAKATAFNSTAIGVATTASGLNATSLGSNATASFDNSTAIGVGATTTAANQMALGTSGNTYRMAGITSAASLAAQTGPVSFVTTDASGNLATSGFNPGSIASLQSQVNTLQSQVLDNRLEARTGTAVALAAGSMPALLPGRRFALSAGYGNYEGANALGIGATALIYDSKSFALVGNLGGAFGLERSSVGGRGAMSLQW